MAKRLEGKRVVVTQAEDFMGPATIALFRAEGAQVIGDTSDLTPPDAAADLIAHAGHVDVLVANLASPNFHGVTVTESTDEQFAVAFDMMVHPLHRLVRALAPQMIERGAGKIVVYGSAVPLRPMARLGAYSTARGAQIAFVKSVGAELARHNIQMNLIAQNWVENEAYYPPSLQANPKFQKNLKAQVPLGRLATAEEDAAFALFLASDESDFFVGQAIPFSGGWAA